MTATAATVDAVGAVGTIASRNPMWIVVEPTSEMHAAVSTYLAGKGAAYLAEIERMLNGEQTVSLWGRS